MLLGHIEPLDILPALAASWRHISILELVSDIGAPSYTSLLDFNLDFALSSSLVLFPELEGIIEHTLCYQTTGDCRGTVVHGCSCGVIKGLVLVFDVVLLIGPKVTDHNDWVAS